MSASEKVFSVRYFHGHRRCHSSESLSVQKRFPPPVPLQWWTIQKAYQAGSARQCAKFGHYSRTMGKEVTTVRRYLSL